MSHPLLLYTLYVIIYRIEMYISIIFFLNDLEIKNLFIKIYIYFIIIVYDIFVKKIFDFHFLFNIKKYIYNINK